MHIHMHKGATLATLALLAAAATSTVHAADFMDALKEQAGKYAMPAMGASTMGNAAGVIQYCVKNNYLSADAAGGIKDKLLGMVSGQKPQQTGYANGAKGLLQGSDGTSLNLKGISGKLKAKACDYVLENAKSLV